MRFGGTLLSVGCGAALILWAGMAGTGLAGEPEQFMLPGADFYRVKALEEVKKKSPETDVNQLRYEGFSYSYHTISAQDLGWFEGIVVQFSDPSKDQFSERDGHHLVSSIRFVVQFARNHVDTNPPKVQVRSYPYTALVVVTKPPRSAAIPSLQPTSAASPTPTPATAP